MATFNDRDGVRVVNGLITNQLRIGSSVMEELPYLQSFTNFAGASTWSILDLNVSNFEGVNANLKALAQSMADAGLLTIDTNE